MRTLIYAALAGLSSAALCGGLTAAPAATKSDQPLPPHHTSVPANPHLHLPSTPQATPTHKPTAVARLTTHSWASHFDAHAYHVANSGTGTISGVVRNASGQPLANARVALRKPGGRLFAHPQLKHVTHTASDGSFVMHDVRPGEYRVFAEVSRKKHAFVKDKVSPGQLLRVAIKI
jgi:hypothetical protein